MYLHQNRNQHQPLLFLLLIEDPKHEPLVIVEAQPANRLAVVVVKQDRAIALRVPISDPPDVHLLRSDGADAGRGALDAGDLCAGLGQPQAAPGGTRCAHF